MAMNGDGVALHPDSTSADPQTSASPPSAAPEPEGQPFPPEIVFRVEDLNCYYGSDRAVRDVTMDIAEREITAMIGPSGCGKTTVLRCFNRMNDLIEGARAEGTLLFRGVNLYDPRVDPVEVRRRVGMVFQKPNRSRSPSSTTWLTARASRARPPRANSPGSWSPHCVRRRCSTR